MKKVERGHGQYVRKVQEQTHRYSHELLVENERLRRSIAVLEAEVARLESKVAECDAAVHASLDLRTTVAALTADKVRLIEQLDDAHRELTRFQSEQNALERRLRLAEEDSRQFSEGYANVERQNENLANLYVASYRLHGTLDRDEVVTAIQEIVANLVGCEEMALFELDPDARLLRLVGSFGIPREPYLAVPLGAGIIGSAAVDGEVVILEEDAAGRSSIETHLTACIPMSLEGAVSGVIALFRLLSHKPALAELDREIFDLLAAQAGSALYCTKLHWARRMGEQGPR